MIKQENLSKSVNIKLERSEPDTSSQLKIKHTAENKTQNKLKFFIEQINDPTVNDDTKIEFRQSRADLNYELQRWEDVIEDVDVLERTSCCSTLSVLRVKADIHLCCKRNRARIMDMIHSGDQTVEMESIFSRISYTHTDEFLNGILVGTDQSTTGRQSKRMKK